MLRVVTSKGPYDYDPTALALARQITAANTPDEVKRIVDEVPQDRVPQLVGEESPPSMVAAFAARFEAMGDRGEVSRYTQGRVLVALGRYEKAREELSAAINGGEDRAHLDLGNLHYMCGEFEEARTHYDAVPEWAHYGFGYLAVYNGDGQGAQTHFRASIEKDEWEGHYGLAQLVSDDRMAEAMAHQVLEKGNTEGWVLLGKIYSKRSIDRTSANAQAAFHNVLRGLESKPGSSLDQKKLATALNYLNMAFEAGHRPYLQRAEVLRRMGQLEEAKTDCRAQLGLESKSYDGASYGQLGLISIAEKDKQAALNHFRKAKALGYNNLFIEFTISDLEKEETDRTQEPTTPPPPKSQEPDLPTEDRQLRLLL